MDIDKILLRNKIVSGLTSEKLKTIVDELLEEKKEPGGYDIVFTDYHTFQLQAKQSIDFFSRRGWLSDFNTKVIGKLLEKCLT